MSLAPTLLTARTIAPGVGLIVTAGLAAGLFTNIARPGVGSVSFLGSEPAVLQEAGPVTYPDPGRVTLGALTFTLKRIKAIAPRLPEGTGTDNDLTPTILRGSSLFAGTPPRALLPIEGRPPVVVQDGSTFLPVSAALAPVQVAGLVPSLAFPEEYGPRLPLAGRMDMIGLEPNLLLDTVVAPGAATLIMRGSVITSGVDYSWQTVELVGVPAWTDVARAT